MSLINDMLKNLEDRKAQGSEGKNDITAGISSAKKSPTILQEAITRVTKKAGESEPVLVGNNKKSSGTLIWRLATIIFVGLLIAIYVFFKTYEGAPLQVTPSIVKKDIIAPIKIAEQKTETVKTEEPASEITQDNTDKTKQVEAAVTTEPSVEKNVASLITLKDINIETKGDNTLIYLDISGETRYQITATDHSVDLTLIQAKKPDNLPIAKNDGSAVKEYTVTQDNDNLIVHFSLAPNTFLDETTYINKDGQKLMVTLKQEKNLAQETSTKPDMTVTEVENAVVKQPVVAKKQLTPTQQAAKNYQQALTDIEEGKGKAAVGLLKNILETLPDYHKVRVALVVYLLDHGQQLEAELYLKEGLENGPNYVPFQLLNVRLLIDKGRLESAKSAMANILPDEKSAVEFYALTGIVNLRLKHYLEAERAYEALIELEPNVGRWWLGLGIASQSLGNKNVATEAYAQAKKLGNNDWHIQTYLNEQLHTLKE